MRQAFVGAGAVVGLSVLGACGSPSFEAPRPTSITVPSYTPTGEVTPPLAPPLTTAPRPSDLPTPPTGNIPLGTRLIYSYDGLPTYGVFQASNEIKEKLFKIAVSCQNKGFTAQMSTYENGVLQQTTPDQPKNYPASRFAFCDLDGNVRETLRNNPDAAAKSLIGLLVTKREFNDAFKKLKKSKYWPQLNG
ncbi:MAG: hypothetical protein WAQ24_02425 [Candidatus Saccharimonadales bacterium]